METVKMKAVVCTKYGSPDFLQLTEIDKPTPKDNEVLIKVQATTATTADSMMRRADPFISRFFLGFTRPKIPVIGTGFAGVVEAVGKAVRKFKVGDPVFGETGVQFSANAEYVSMPEDGVLAIKPDNLSFEEAAPLCDGPMTAYNFLKEVGGIKTGQKVLINGASGSIGTAAMQIAKSFGAEVTSVSSAKNFELVKSLGADHLIDYTKEDFTQQEKQYDIIFDTVGKRSFKQCKKALTTNGKYLSPVLDFTLLFQMMWTAKFSKKKALFSATGLKPAPQLRLILEELKQLLKIGQLKMVIDKRYTLEQTAQAHHYIDKGHKTGSIILLPSF